MTTTLPFDDWPLPNRLRFVEQLQKDLPPESHDFDMPKLEFLAWLVVSGRLTGDTTAYRWPFAVLGVPPPSKGC